MPDGVTAPPAPMNTRAGEPLRREASFKPGSWNAAKRTIDVIFTTGADVKRTERWSGRTYIERLRVDESAVNLTRLNAGAPVLNTHSSYDLADVIGVVERAWIDGTEGWATLRFSEREDVAPFVADIAAGIIRNISVGYWTDKTVTTQATDGSLEIREAVEWTPGEISFVPVPADPGAQVRSGQPPAQSIAQQSATPAPTTIHQQEARMAEVNTPPANPAPASLTAEKRQALEMEAREAETARVRDIGLAGRTLGIAEAEVTGYINSGLSVADAQRRMIDALAARATEVPKPGHITITRDQVDTQRAGLEIALAHRAGVATGDLPEVARPYRGLRLLDMARMSVEMAGGSTRGLMPAEIAKAALGLTREAGMHSVSDFPNLLANTASKGLGNGYGSARRTFTAWARRRTLPDFKTFRVINMSGAPALSLVSTVGADAGEIEFGTIGEMAETYQLGRYGKRIAITFEAVVNDDLNAFSRVPQMFGVAAARLESTLVYGQFNSNPNMSDGNALFSTAHNNVFGTGSGASSPFNANGAIAVTGLGLARQAMRTQTAPNGDLIDAMPKFLLVPAALEGLALQFTSMAYVSNAPGSINPFAQALTPLVEPRLTSASQWYVIADNAEVDTVEYGYLEGMETPQITSYVDQNNDGVTIKCTHSFGCKATDWRGMVRSTGT